MKITTFDKRNTKALQEAIVAALDKVGAEFGVSLKGHGGSLATDHVILKIKATVSDPAAAEALAKQKFSDYCSMFGLKPEHYGASVIHKREAFTLVGLIPSRPKFPFLCRRDSDGKELLLTEASVRHLQEKRGRNEELEAAFQLAGRM
jgi:hypothetical protein